MCKEYAGVLQSAFINRKGISVTSQAGVRMVCNTGLWMVLQHACTVLSQVINVWYTVLVVVW